MAGTRRLNELVTEAAESLELPDAVSFAVALSGGADSAALAYLLAGSGRSVRALHVDHGLPGSPGMRAAAVGVAGSLGIPLEVVETTVPEGASPEGQARSARYRAFAEAVPADEPLLTAHTADDNVETVIINLVRGSSTRGLSGIPWHRPPNVYRPMLRVTRGSAREIAVLAGLGFMDDPMNLDPGLARNYIRQVVMPTLRALEPGVATRVSRSSELLRADAGLLDQWAEATTLRITADGVLLVVGELLQVPAPIAGRIVMRGLATLGVEPSSDRVHRVLEVVRGRAASAEIADGIVAALQGPLLRLSPGRPDGAGTVALPVGETTHRGMVYQVISHDGPCQVAPLGSWHAIFPPGTELSIGPDGVVLADGQPAWEPGVRRLPVAWYKVGTVGYLSVLAREESGWTSSP
jgi:tRNA(Ile)-lysidine synthetase-like protein